VFTCPNPSCRKVFSTPLKTLNLQQDATEPYNACPYCLTKINEPPLKTEDKLEIDQVEQAPPVENKVTSKVKSKATDKPPACHKHLGYLSERAQNEQISDDCLVCKNIVECMLKKMRAQP
jgi:hypothetical protein